MGDENINVKVAVINALQGLRIIVPRVSSVIRKREDKSNSNADKTSLFHVPLAIVVDRCPIRKADLILPRFVVEITERLNEWLGTEGLFRVNGSNVRMQRMEHSISQGLPIESTAVVHDLTGVLKHFLRELPTPLLSHWLYPVFIQAYQLSPAERPRAILLLVLLLPKVHIDMIQYLMALMNAIVTYPGSKMSAGNLAAIFAPNILRPLDDDEKSVGKRKQLTSDLELANHTSSVGVVELLITHYKDVGRVPQEIVRAQPYEFSVAMAKWNALHSDPPKKGFFPCCSSPVEEEETSPLSTKKPVDRSEEQRRSSKATLDLIHHNVN